MVLLTQVSFNDRVRVITAELAYEILYQKTRLSGLPKMKTACCYAQLSRHV